jgi:hypothetical protein
MAASTRKLLGGKVTTCDYSQNGYLFPTQDLESGKQRFDATTVYDLVRTG